MDTTPNIAVTAQSTRRELDDTVSSSSTTAVISGYEVPVDPMDLLQCDSCQ